MHQIVVCTTDDRIVGGVIHEMDLEAVKATVQQLLSAEGGGYFVLEIPAGWAILPTRSISMVQIVEAQGA